MNPWVVRREDTYWLYYAGADADQRRRICLATAPVSEPTRWTRQGVVLDIGAPGSFDAQWVVLPHVIRMGRQWFLYYTANCGQGEGLSAFPGIGLAVSEDGRTFERYGEGPVLAPGGSPGDPDRIGIAGGSLIAMPCVDGGTEWWFYYTGCPTLGPNVFEDQQKTICLAVSRDGIAWEKRGALMKRMPERDYVDIAVAGPVVWREDAGLFRMLYSAIGTRWGYYSIAYAESDDGLCWRRGERAGDDLTLGRHGDGWERQMVEYPTVVREGAGRRLFYCGNGYGKTGIGTALACPLRAVAVQGPSQCRVIAPEAGFEWSLRMPEAISCDEGVFKSWETPILDWHGPDADGMLWQAWASNDEYLQQAQTNPNYKALGIRIIGGIEFRTVIRHVDDGLEIHFTVCNRSDRTFHNLIAHPCLGMPSPGFADATMTRTMIVTEAGLTPLSQTDRGTGDPVRTWYRVGDHSPGRWTPTCFWGDASDTRAVQGIVLRTDEAERWTIAMGWQSVASIFHNNDSHHRCMHAVPALGDLAAGDSRTVIGWLTFQQQSPAVVLASMETRQS